MIETLKAIGLAWLTISLGTMMFNVYLMALAMKEKGHEEDMERNNISKWGIAGAILFASVLFPLGWKWILDGMKENR